MENSIKNTQPELMKEWDYKKNISYTPDIITYGSNQKVWWICKKGHSYTARVANRVFGKTGCPYCSNNKVMAGFNDLQTTSPHLAKQWHPTKNGTIFPTDVLPHGKYKYWWQCEKGHSWQARLYERSYGTGCPYCSNKKILEGYNDLKSRNPKVASEWHEEKNCNLKASQVSVGSNKKVWWKCSHGHEWNTTISSRTLANTGCSVCSNHKIIKGENDIITLYPELLNLWDFKKNINIDLYSLSKSTNYKAWWICKNNHSFSKKILSMTRNKECPICRKKQLELERTQIVENLSSERKAQIKSKSIATINKKLLTEWDFEKNKNFNPKVVPASSREKVWWKCKYGHSWEAQVFLRNRGAGCHACTGYKIYKGYSDILTTRPDMKSQWDFEKNKDTDIYTVSEKSHTRVWWICENGHSWKESVVSRCKTKFCPSCYNMHGTSFPEQAVYYYIKNYFPKSISRYRLNGEHEIDIYIPNKKIGIEYDGMYYHSGKLAKQKELQKEKIFQENNISLIRIKESPHSKGIKILKNKTIIYYKQKEKFALSGAIKSLLKFLKIDSPQVDVDSDMYTIINSYINIANKNSVQALMPEKSKEWNIEKNKPMTPDKLSAKSDVKVWWKCIHGHEWKTSPIKRYSENTNCPYCANKKVQAGFNDLQTLNPKLANEWHPTKNGKLKPTQFTFCSGKKIWWQCANGHVWKTSIAHRKNNRGCKVCKKRTIIKGVNDMLSFRPELINEWDFNKNVGINPEEMFKSSEKKVWWKCIYGHSWITLISDRVKGTNCPVCSHQKIVKGINDVETLKPELAKIWHPSKNKNKSLSDFSKCSEEKVWWQCANGHEFYSTIYTKYASKHLCKYCYAEQKRKK